MSCETKDKTALANELLTFIDQSPTAYHAVSVIAQTLSAKGFVALSEGDDWALECGGKYYVTRNGSSLLAFALPSTESAVGYRIVAAHTDSPAFKLKDIFDRPSEGYSKLNVEKYGGMLCSTWMDRPLSVAGRVLLSSGNGVQSRLVRFEDPIALIPSVAIHMDRNANDGKSYNAQVDMLPILDAGKDIGSFKNQLLRKVGVEETALLSHDLYLYVQQKGYLWGENDALISAPRIDDLMCVFGGMVAFCEEIAATDIAHIPMLAAFDNEEVGSHTLQGAASSFMEDTIARIEHFLGNNRDDADGKFKRMSNSLMLSADNGHAVHPNHPEYADAQNRPTIGGGVVLKFNAQQRYATDAVGAAIFRSICLAADVRVQTFANRSDMMGGSTLGNIANTRVPIRTVDIGLPQLAMHSAFETAGTSDFSDYVSACRAFYRANIRMIGDDGYRVEVI